MIRLILIILMLSAIAAQAANDAARGHIDAAIQQVDRADANTELLEKALTVAVRQTIEMKHWGVGQQARADEAEAYWGYRWGKRIDRLLFWGAIIGVVAYATPIILRLIGLVSTGPYGAIASVAGSAIAGALPGGGWISSVADNVWFRKVKPQADEYQSLKQGAR